MERRRRVVRLAGAGLVTGLAGCSGLVSENDVPGGIKFRNRRPRSEVVTVRLYRLAPQTPDDTTPTPVDTQPVFDGQFRLKPQWTGVNDSVFPSAGTYLVEASNRGTTVRERIKLFETLGGGVGVDTVVVTLPAAGDIQLRVTDVD